MFQVFYVCCIKSRIIMFYGFSAAIIIVIFSSRSTWINVLYLLLCEKRMKRVIHFILSLECVRYSWRKRCFADKVMIFCLFWFQFQCLSDSLIVGHLLFTSRQFLINNDVVGSTNFLVNVLLLFIVSVLYNLLTGEEVTVYWIIPNQIPGFWYYAYYSQDF